MLLFAALASSVAPMKARAEAQTDWIIRDFKSTITLNKDNTLKVQEQIEADCGNLPEKHGIFRVLPMQLSNGQGGAYKNPIYLESITNSEGKAYKYTETIDSENKTVSWQIGDPNKVVHGLNQYFITYTVKNVIRSENSSAFDELYWNLNGNFWEIPIEKFSATIILPKEIKSGNSSLNVYSGGFGVKDANLVDYTWSAQNAIEVNSITAFDRMQGVTVSLSFPKEIVSPYKITRQDEARIQGSVYLKDSVVLFLLILSILLPFAMFFALYKLWKRFGQDPRINRTIMPEFDVPEALAPIEMGLIDGNGTLSSAGITAGIIGLATKGYLKIEDLPKKGILGSQDYKFVKLEKTESGLLVSEKYLLEKLFKTGNEVLMSSLKNKFYKDIEVIKKAASEQLNSDQLIDKKASNIAIGLYVVAFLVCFPLFIASTLIVLNTAAPLASILITGLVVLIFAIIMPRRPLPGLKMYQRIKGFKMFMDKAEKYRQPYLEKEGLFERLLPYAILFGITKKWMKAMRSIYGEEYFNSYVPIWYYGGVMNSFNFNDFSSHINSMASSMSTTMASNPSSSGSGGGGFSGGGGGGGGGGGW